MNSCFGTNRQPPSSRQCLMGRQPEAQTLVDCVNSDDDVQYDPFMDSGGVATPWSGGKWEAAGEEVGTIHS